MSRKHSVFAKFKFFAHIRIMYDGGSLRYLGGCPLGGVPYVRVFFKGGLSAYAIGEPLW